MCCPTLGHVIFQFWQRCTALNIRFGSGFANGEKGSKWCSVKVVSGYCRHTIASWGTWCSGITSASHAEGPGFKSQCVHLSRMACVYCACVPSATAYLRAFCPFSVCCPTLGRAIFQFWQRCTALNIRFRSGFANGKKEANHVLRK